MEDSPKGVCAVLLQVECLLRRFFEVACKSGGEIGATDTQDHAVGEDWDFGRAKEESDI